MTTKVRASHLRLAMTAMAKSDIRYYLNGILIEPRAEGGAYIVATDGHRMMVIIDAQAKCSERVIIKPNRYTGTLLPKVVGNGDTDMATVELTSFNDKPALLVRDKNGQPMHLQIEDAVVDDTTKRDGEIIDTRFPKWRKVLPDFGELKKSQADALNMDYVHAPRSAIRAGRYSSIFMQPYQVAPNRVVAFRFPEHLNVLYLVMPGSGDDKSLEWISTWAPANLPAKVPA